jgi:hypothetical protein
MLSQMSGAVQSVVSRHSTHRLRAVSQRGCAASVQSPSPVHESTHSKVSVLQVSPVPVQSVAAMHWTQRGRWRFALQTGRCVGQVPHAADVPPVPAVPPVVALVPPVVALVPPVVELVPPVVELVPPLPPVAPLAAEPPVPPAPLLVSSSSPHAVTAATASALITIQSRIRVVTIGISSVASS